jgi:hypothetical protein
MDALLAVLAKNLDTALVAVGPVVLLAVRAYVQRWAAEQAVKAADETAKASAEVKLTGSSKKALAKMELSKTLPLGVRPLTDAAAEKAVQRAFDRTRGGSKK